MRCDPAAYNYVLQGTADAIRQYAWLLSDIKNRSIEDVVILSGDHLYRMDYMKFVNYHRCAAVHAALLQHSCSA